MQTFRYRLYPTACQEQNLLRVLDCARNLYNMALAERKYAGQLSSILGYFRRLQEIDTSHIEPTASVLPLQNVMRADIPTPALSPDKVIRNAPDSLGSQFLVSIVLDQE